MLIEDNGGGATTPDASTIICYTNHYEGRVFVVTLLMILAIIIQIGVIYMTWSVNRKTALFPLKGRAPRLVIIQLIYYLILGILPIIVEFLEIVRVDWGKTENNNQEKQYATRKFLKTLIFLARLWIIFIYAFRLARITIELRSSMQTGKFHLKTCARLTGEYLVTKCD